MGQGADPAIVQPTMYTDTDYATDRDRHRSLDAIQREIDQTQAQMTETLDAIQRKLTPSKWKEEAMSMLNVSENGTLAEIGDTIRENPIPTALIGIGVAWLAVSSMRGGEHEYASISDEGRHGRRDRSMAERAKGGLQSAAESVRSAAHTVSDKVSSAAHSARERMGTARRSGNVRRDYPETHTTDYGYDQAVEGRGYAETSYDYSRENFGEDHERPSRAEKAAARQYYRKARQQVSHASHSFWDMVDEHPLAAGVMGLAIGAALGVTLPSSRYENEWLGEWRDDLVERGRGVGQGIVDRVGEVARSAAESGIEAAQNTATEEARRRGLTPEHVKSEIGRSGKPI